ncbi:MAG: hypothetical protein JSS95_06915 [Acidobacteria bacterium]|nr:hypothetical protein [Acidobacteriota bacterium]
MMQNALLAGLLLSLVSGLMNGTFTLPMRFLGKWSWENVWSIFIVGSCLLLPAAVIAVSAPHSWNVIAHIPVRLELVALATGLAWGFGAIMFGQAVSAIGISMANTFVLATSSALGAMLPMIILHPEKLRDRSGTILLAGVAVEIFGIVLCGRGGFLREKSVVVVQRDFVGKTRPLHIGFLLALGSGVLSAVFNIGFAMSQPISQLGQEHGLSPFASTNLIWFIMLGGGAVSNLGYCVYLLLVNKSASKFAQPGSLKLYILSLCMAVLWGGSIFVYGAATLRLGVLGTSVGWPLSLATGLLVANFVGFATGEWKCAPRQARIWMGSGIVVLIFAIVVMSRAI